MQTQVIVSAIGKDRPGIVHRVSEVIVRHRGNITVQRSVKLGGDFAIILMFTVDVPGAAALEPILADIAGLSTEQLHVTARPATDDAQPAASICELRVTGADQPGIINTLTLFLMEHGANIHSMDYTVASGPFSAAPIFTATAMLSLPTGKDLKTFDAGLKELESDLNVDIEIDAAAGG